jgi:hypothetical protein
VAVLMLIVADAGMFSNCDFWSHNICTFPCNLTNSVQVCSSCNTSRPERPSYVGEVAGRG